MSGLLQQQLVGSHAANCAFAARQPRKYVTEGFASSVSQLLNSKPDAKSECVKQGDDDPPKC